MAMMLSPAGQHAQDLSLADSAGRHDFDRQRLRILRCTAQAMASSPGGLRFKAGTQPWLEGIPGGRPALPLASRRRTGTAAHTAVA